EQVDLFVVRDEPSPWGRRFAAAGTLGALIALGAYALSPGQASTPPNPGPTVGAEVRPLELLGLRHTQDADSLTISGLVLNPRGGAVVRHVSASVVLFGSDGGFLASGRAGLDYVTLAPGDESPFVIKIPVAGTVSRYRVGFRGPDGAVIAHVDRRADGTSARNERIMGSVP
ncbi:MAG: hypothetical protein ACRD15_05350, partial [Vicinamibacterales bacterium]